VHGLWNTFGRHASSVDEAVRYTDSIELSDRHANGCLRRPRVRRHE
jgi:hypothetical protein